MTAMPRRAGQVEHAPPCNAGFAKDADLISLAQRGARPACRDSRPRASMAGPAADEMAKTSG